MLCAESTAESVPILFKLTLPGHLPVLPKSNLKIYLRESAEANLTSLFFFAAVTIQNESQEEQMSNATNEQSFVEHIRFACERKQQQSTNKNVFK